jgi:hypothetical protein
MINTHTAQLFLCSQMKMLDEMQDEIRKLKAMIVKHEKRIRVLEAKAGEDGDKNASLPPLPVTQPPPGITVNNNNAHPPEEMAPDEV